MVAIARYSHHKLRGSGADGEAHQTVNLTRKLSRFESYLPHQLLQGGKNCHLKSEKNDVSNMEEFLFLKLNLWSSL